MRITSNLLSTQPDRNFSVWLFIILFLVCALSSKAQSDTIQFNPQEPIHNYSEILKKRYWNFFIRPLVSFQKGNYYKDKAFSFSLKPALGFQFGWMMSFGLPKHFAIQTGINVEINYIRINYSVREGYFMQSQPSNFNEKALSYFGFILPVYLSYRIPINNQKHSFFVEPKIGFRF